LRGPWTAPFLVAAAFASLAAPASASQLVDRDVTGVKLTVDADGEALVQYTAAGHVRRVLAWGAVNALPPTPGGKQVAFSLDYSGGYAKYHRNYWQTFPKFCGRYDGPRLSWFVKACKAPDGSYWALQEWQRELPDYGVAPSRTQASRELRLSHFTLAAALPVLDIHTDWGYSGRWAHLFGTFTYAGAGVHGFGSTATGVPTDSFGRNIYVDTFDSAYPGGGPVASREQLPGPRPGGNVLLPVRPARLAPERDRDDLPGDGDRPRRAPGSVLAGSRAGALRPRG
jgi:hypothetical protein